MSIKTIHNIIDINADVGEGVGNEADLLPFLSSCNIACGGHAGDNDTMRSAALLAKQCDVKIGAHPSFPDAKNFGRLEMKISSEALLASLTSQVSQLLSILKSNNLILHHIKPHGALYNLANKDVAYATIVIALMKNFDSSVKLYAPYGALVARMAQERGIAVVYEAFADRNYNADHTLVARSQPNALIEDTAQLCGHVVNMVLNQRVTAINGTEIPIKADTVCLHGDHPQAQHHIKMLTETLKTKNIQIL